MSNQIKRQPEPYPLVAVAVVAPEGSHTGVLFRDADENERYLHLRAHCYLELASSIEANTGWVTPGHLPEDRLNQVVAMCEQVWERNKKNIPYGFRYDAATFSKNGEITLGKDECGFTCATFVMAVFHSVGVELLVQSGWPERADDKERFEEILQMFEEHANEKRSSWGEEKYEAWMGHLDVLRKQTSAPRFRPLEVAGGSMGELPAGFEQAESAARALEQELKGPAAQTPKQEPKGPPPQGPAGAG